ncbi:MAG: adenylate/guanylate cyclase domain-containing protein [Pseudomonadota bacterium]
MPDLVKWLETNGLSELGGKLAAEDIEFDLLTELTNDDMREMGLSIGQRKRLQKAIKSIGSRQSLVQDHAPVALAEKRQVTILFCDLVGSTKISQSLDPEQMFELLGLYQRNAAEVIARYDGHVAQFLGDGVFVYFGYPMAHEDDSQRAILAAFDLIETTAALQTGLDRPLSVRIGIDNGPVVIGDLRMNMEGDIDAIAGETPNRTAKIQSMAKPNEIAIGDRLKDMLGVFVTCEDLGMREVGSGLAPQHGWKVTGFSERSGRLNRRQHGVSAPLIGREGERQVLDKAWEDVCRGENRVLMIKGEPGIGKSRMIGHLINTIPKASRRALSFFCSSYHKGTAFWPIADQLRRIAGITYRDSPDSRMEKAQELLRLAENRGLPRQLLPMYEALIIDDESKVETATPEERKAMMISTLFALLYGRAQERPVLLVCEDLHWCDPSTLDAWKHLVSRSSKMPVLFAFTYRPEFETPWLDRPNATEISLERIDLDQTRELIRGVASGKRLPEKVEREVLEKADGVPLFVEELTRSLLSSGVMRERDDHYELIDDTIELDVPATLNEALMTRIDRMNELREVTLWAAALGRRFTVDQLCSVAPFSRQDIFAALGQLTSSDLLQKIGSGVIESYEFRHVLVRETAYNSMLASKRKRIHAAIIEGLTRMDEDLINRQPDLFYHHYLGSDNKRQAFECAIAAGDLIAARYRGPESRGHYQAAWDLISQFDRTDENNRLRIRASIKLATSAAGPEAIATDLERLKETVTLSEELDMLPRRVQAHYWTARLKYDAMDENGAMKDAIIAANLAEPTNDPRIRSGPENLLAFLYSLQGNPAKGIAMTERNAKDLEALGDRREAAVMAGIYAFALGSGGNYTRAEAAAASAIDKAEELAHSQSLSVACFSMATVLGWQGRTDKAKPWIEKALNASREAKNLFQTYATYGWAGEALMNQVWLERDFTELPSVIEHLERALRIASKIGVEFHVSAFRAHLAHAELRSGHLDEATKVLDSAFEIAAKAKQAWGLSIAQRVRAEIALETGKASQRDVIEGLESAIHHQRVSGLKPELIRSLDTHARLTTASGDHSAAGVSLNEIREVSESLGTAAE